MARRHPSAADPDADGHWLSNWSGAEAGTRDLFHWISAAIALPTLAYSGQVFFRSAWHGLRRGKTNMDVPISIGVLLAFGMSLWETIGHGPQAYFDASVSLLFFLLIGRTLDHVMRNRARQAVDGLARLSARGALWQRPDGTPAKVELDDVCTFMARFANGSNGTFEATRYARGRKNKNSFEVNGERGSIYFDLEDMHLLCALEER